MMTATDQDTSPQVLETYALLQIAAEAMFDKKHIDPAAIPGTGATRPGTVDFSVLTLGNDHSSKMTTEQAKQFASEWKVISRQPNTATGFSGTLFQYTGRRTSSRSPGRAVRCLLPLH